MEVDVSAEAIVADVDKWLQQLPSEDVDVDKRIEILDAALEAIDDQVYQTDDPAERQKLRSIKKGLTAVKKSADNAKTAEAVKAAEAKTADAVKAAEAKAEQERAGRKAAEARAAKAIQEKEQAIGKTLWTDGFPRIVCRLSPKTKKGHVPKDSEHAKAELRELAFCYDKLDCPERSASLVWMAVQHHDHDGEELHYVNEDTTHDHVMEVIRDIVRQVLKVPGFDTLQLEVFRNPHINRLKPDLWVVTRFGMPVGAIEVKMPEIGNEASSFPLDEPNVYGQMYDYLVLLRNMHNVSGFGILTTYRHWRICWLPESNAMAADAPLANLKLPACLRKPHILSPRPQLAAIAESSRPSRPSKVTANAKISRDIADQLTDLELDGRVLCGSRLIRSNEEDLIHVLFSAMRKMCTLNVRVSLDDILQSGRACVCDGRWCCCSVAATKWEKTKFLEMKIFCRARTRPVQNSNLINVLPPHMLFQKQPVPTSWTG